MLATHTELPSNPLVTASDREHIPSFPPEFGGDNGEFLKHYDKIQRKLDKKMVERLKDSLDTTLIYVCYHLLERRRCAYNLVKTGLFASVNSAFIALTLVLMQPDPLDDISTLLQQLILGFKSPTSLPSMTFTPSFQAFAINGLFSFSMSLALFVAFFAVIGREWVRSYGIRNGGGIEAQRWEKLRRSMGAERWGLHNVLEFGLPLLVQVALGVFSTGFVLLLRTMSRSLSNFVLLPLLVAVFLFLLMLGLSIWDRSCPFRTALSEIIVDIPRSLSAIEFTIPRVPSGISSDTRMLKVKLPEWMSNRRALRNLETSKGDGGAVVGEVCSRYDEEKGNVDTDVKVRSVQTSPVSQDAGQPRPGRERLRSLVRTTMLRRRQAMTNPNARFWGLIEGLQWGKKAKEVRVLQVESIMRVIRISEDPSALYHAALNLRSISDPKLLALVCADETSTRGLRECYLEALEDLDKKVHSATALTLRLRETLGFGTAIFHVALSADSFDDFIQTIGIRGASLPRSTSKMSAEASRVAGEICRSAEASLRLFMSLQLRRLGAQPVELTSTTLAASALWYAINGFPHSQDILYGYRFREALGTSQVSWACLGLLACVSNIPCRFHDARKKKPYGMTEINWCREAFLRVRDAYHSSEPTQELAAAIGHSFSTGKNLETNTALFIFTWRLFAKNDHGKPAFVKLGENALSAGKHLICTIEKSIRSSKNDEIYRKHAELRERFFKVMMDCMGHRDGEIKALKGVLWRHRLTLITATAYMEYIMGLEGPVNKRENARAEEFMQRIRDAQIQNFRTSLAMDQDYADARHAFEGVISKFGVHDGAASVILDDSAAIVSIVDSPNDLRP